MGNSASSSATKNPASATNIPSTGVVNEKDDDHHLSSMNQKPEYINISATEGNKISDHSKDKLSNQMSGMKLVHYVCRKRKKIYDECVSNWYSNEFIVGKSINQEEECGDKFELYRTCILKGVKQEVWDKQYQLPPPHENSPLMEIIVDDEDNPTK